MLDSQNNPIVANLAFAVDAVRDSGGNIVCAATIPGHARFNAAAAGCVPLNLFGEGNASPAALDYFQGDPHSEVTYEQSTFGANLSGELFATWAGPIAVATGVEYRDEEEEVTADEIAAAGGFFTANNSPYSGKLRRGGRLCRSDPAVRPRCEARQIARPQPALTATPTTARWARWTRGKPASCGNRSRPCASA